MHLEPIADRPSHRFHCISQPDRSSVDGPWRQRRLKSILSIVVLLVLSACASLIDQEQRVKISINDMVPLDATLMEQRYLIKLRVQNRSGDPLVIDGMSFDLKLNGKAFASGVSNQQISVPAYAESLLEVKVSSTIFGIIRQFQSLEERRGKPFAYELSGSLSSPGSLFNIPFREIGEIALGANP